MKVLMKSSKVTAASEFNPDEMVLRKEDETHLSVSESHTRPHLRDPLKTPATNNPVNPGMKLRLSMTKSG